ncbi:hypothetical protein OC861_004325 [Tilletia horrida]|nr:hypothetical protein OC861_004325 [Tilletia horrida]
MQFTTYTLLGSALLAATMVAAQTGDGLTVSTLPLITTCAVNRLTWTGGAAPYIVSIIVPGQPTQMLQSLGNTNNNYLPYTPDGKTTGIAAGDSVAVYVSDNNGFATASAGIPVVAGPCSGAGSSSSSASSASTSAASTSSSASSSAAPSTSSTLSTSTSTRASSTTTSAAPTTSAPSGAAAPALNGLTAVIAGAVGVVAAALI